MLSKEVDYSLRMPITDIIASRDSRQGMMTLYLPFDDATWSKLFGALEKAKKQLHIETYSLSQTTLEQIFLSFTKAQENVE